jgi:nucleotide-binding universal stress UspA family protein
LQLFERILIPVDGSPQSHNALMKGVELAKIDGSKIEILHVTTFSEEYPGFMSMNGNSTPQESAPPEWISEYIDNIRQNDRKMLDEASKSAKSIAPKLEITVKLLTGRAVENVLEEADRGKFDLIIMGCRGLGGFREIVLGSVSHGVVNGSKIPVLIVK